MLKKISFFSILFAVGFFAALPVQAFCPVCTVAVGAGVGLAEWLGIDGTIIGLWLGGMAVSLTMWTLNWLTKRKWNFSGEKILITVLYYVLIVAPLFTKGFIGNPYQKILGIDKLIFGMIIGSAVFLGGGLWYERMKRRNGGHAHFPFQKVVMPIAPLIISSILFYFLTK